MFLKQNAQVDPRQKALDSALMLLVHKKMTARERPAPDLKTKYPPARNGATNFEPRFNPNARRRIKRAWGDDSNLNDMVEGGFTSPEEPHFDNAAIDAMLRERVRPTPGPATGGTFNPLMGLDTSQVEDRRQDLTGLQKVAALYKSGAMAGDGRLERPAPGMTLDPDSYPGQSAPAGGSNRQALLQMLMQRMKSGGMR